MSECCQYGWGGYGADGDANCCTAPKVWVKSKTACLTPCSSVKCPDGQTQNGQQYQETAGSCCQTSLTPKIYTGMAKINLGTAGSKFYLCASECIPPARLIPCSSRTTSSACINPYNDYLAYHMEASCQCAVYNYPDCPAGQTDQQICSSNAKGYRCLKQNTGIIYSIDARAGLISGTLADMAGGSGRSGGMIVMSTHTACACKWSGNKCGTDYNGVIVIGVSNCGRIVAEANRAEIQYLSCE